MEQCRIALISAKVVEERINLTVDKTRSVLLNAPVRAARTLCLSHRGLHKPWQSYKLTLPCLATSFICSSILTSSRLPEATYRRVQIAADLTRQYVLSYYALNNAHDGRFRPFSPRVMTRSNTRVCAQGLLRAEELTAPANPAAQIL